MLVSAENVTPTTAIVEIQRWVLDRLGIDYPEHKLGVLESKLSGLCRELQIDSLDQLRLRLRSAGSDIQARVAHAVSTNHTFFFREPETFERLGKEVLPTLQTSNDVRVWSAASSTGEEAYSLAIVASNTLGPQWASDRLNILGTDISSPVIQTAETGVYTNLNGVSASDQLQYFHRRDASYAATNSLKQLCMFRRLNLFKSNWPFRRQFQIILCRNVLYYFSLANQADVLRQMHAHCAPGGWLVTSVTESIRGLDVPWNSVGSGFYRKAP